MFASCISLLEVRDDFLKPYRDNPTCKTKTAMMAKSTCIALIFNIKYEINMKHLNILIFS